MGSNSIASDGRILLLSGPLAVGKSTAATELVQFYGFGKIESGRYLAQLAADSNLDGSRAGLQRLGDDLDVKTDYRWLISDVTLPLVSARPEIKRWLLDAVRKRRQIAHFRTEYGSRVAHVHLNAS